MMKTKPTWIMIKTQPQLQEFCKQQQSAPWLAFDTEFIPERYFHSKLCLISAAVPDGNVIIDVLNIPDISPFLQLVEDPRILKITHAGENDYRILVKNYKTKPRNLFDTQLAYGFLNFEYPLGLQHLLEKELNLRIDKSELRSDWEQRPLSSEQIDYAVRDVLYLHKLMKRLETKLFTNNKLAWAREENLSWENVDYFESDPLDFLNGVSLRNYSRKQLLFLIRLYRWRRDKASEKNRPAGEILKTRHINTIIKHINKGKNALLKDRTMPDFIVEKYWHNFQHFYTADITDEEKHILDELPRFHTISPQLQVMMDMLIQMIKWKAAHYAISPALILSRKDLEKMKTDADYFPQQLNRGWRKKLLGDGLLAWLKKRNPIHIVIDGQQCVLTMPESPRP